MTYVTLDIFEKFLRVTGITNGYEYKELYRRKLIPTKLLPRIPHKYYKAPPGSGVTRGTYVPRGTYSKMFEKKYGMKFNKKFSKHRRLYRALYWVQPEVRARSKAYNRSPKVIARRKVPKNLAKKKAYDKGWRVKPKVKARRNSPESKARQKAWRSTPEQTK